MFSVLLILRSAACDLFLCYCIAFVRRYSGRFARIEIQQGFRHWRIKKLLQQGELVKFYQTARTHMGQLEWSDIRGGVSPDKLDRLLLIARITSAAPLFGENENTPFEQMTQDFASAGDIRLKGKVMKTYSSFQNQSQAKCSAVRKKEVGQLCSIYAATMLKMMKEAYIPDFEGWKKEVMERKRRFGAKSLTPGGSPS